MAVSPLTGLAPRRQPDRKSKIENRKSQIGNPQGCLVLIGMPGVGKSTVGILLAKQLARPFVDVDVYIQAGSDRTLQEIIAATGLEAFCDLEAQYVCCLDLANHVVATGGSVVYREQAMGFLAAKGTIVYLALPLEALLQRLSDLRTRGVVLAPGMMLADLHAQRTPLYERWADVTIDCTGLDHQGVVDAIIQKTEPRTGNREPGEKKRK